MISNKDIYSFLDTFLNIGPADYLAIEFVNGRDGTWDSDSGSIASFNGRTVPSRMAVGVVVMLSNGNGCCTDESDPGKLHCEEANS